MMDIVTLALSSWAELSKAVVEPISKLCIAYWKQSDRTVLFTLLGLATGFTIGRYRTSRSVSYQNRGEALLSDVIQRNFSSPDYHLMNHVTLQMKDGTTQIDHILVSRYGVFVIETKDYSGWLFANATRASWTQVLFNDRFGFQNPVHQNARHMRAVVNLLDFLPHGAVKPVVVFTGDAEFKTEVPKGVFRLSEFIDYLRKHTDEVMSLNRVQFCVGRLETARFAITAETDVKHVENLRRRH